MTCPECETGKLYVDKTVIDNDATVVYRKRRCSRCGIVLYTTEQETPSAQEQFRSAWNARTLDYMHATENHNHARNSREKEL